MMQAKTGGEESDKAESCNYRGGRANLVPPRGTPPAREGAAPALIMISIIIIIIMNTIIIIIINAIISIIIIIIMIIWCYLPLRDLPEPRPPFPVLISS